MLLWGWLLGACAPWPTLLERFDQTDIKLTLADRMDVAMRSQEIIVGLVTGVQYAGELRSARVDRRFKIRLVRISVFVERVVSGRSTPPRIEVLYYTYVPEESTGSLGTGFYRPRKGQTRICFLDDSGGYYRPIRDILDLPLRVSSENTASPCGNQTPGCCIAHILLEPAHLPASYWFLGDLYSSTYISTLICSKAEVYHILEGLTHRRDVALAEAAAGILRAFEEADSREQLTPSGGLITPQQP